MNLLGDPTATFVLGTLFGVVLKIGLEQYEKRARGETPR